MTSQHKYSYKPVTAMDIDTFMERVFSFQSVNIVRDKVVRKKNIEPIIVVQRQFVLNDSNIAVDTGIKSTVHTHLCRLEKDASVEMNRLVQSTQCNVQDL
jgi:hypothetical protein